jgi:hypothetical protein
VVILLNRISKMRLSLILLVFLPILLSLAEGAPKTPAKTPAAPSPSPATGTTGAKKGKQLVYFSPRADTDVVEPIQGLQHDEPEDADEGDGDDNDDDVEDTDTEDADDDADDDVDDDDDGFRVPDFNEVFPNPDGRPVGPNSYAAFLKHNPTSQGPAANGQAGPLAQGQAGPAGAGQAGPGQGQRRWRTQLDLDDFGDSYEAGPPPFPGAVRHRGGPPPGPGPVGYDDEFYPPTRAGRQGYVQRVVYPNYVQTSRRPIIYRPVTASNRNYNVNYVPYRRPTSGVFYANNVRPQPQVVNNYNRRVVHASTRPVVPMTVARPTVVQSARPAPAVYAPVRRTVVPAMNYNYNRPRVVSAAPVPVRVPYAPRASHGHGTGRAWSYSPLAGDNYNPQYVVNPTEMLSRRVVRYHPSQAMPIQRINPYHGVWGNPRNIQRDPWTGNHYHGGYWSSQI